MAELVHRFTTGQVDNGTWLAISTRVPYFCLEGESQAEVEAKANRALDFYFGGQGRVVDWPGPLETQRQLHYICQNGHFPRVQSGVGDRGPAPRQRRRFHWFGSGRRVRTYISPG